MMMLPRWVVYPEVPLPIQSRMLQPSWNLATVADTDDDNLEKAIVRISAGFATGEDVLAATVGSTGLSASYTASTGILEITGTGTKAQYQEVLRTVTYDNTNDMNREPLHERLFGSCLTVPTIHQLARRQLILLRLMMRQQVQMQEQL